MSIAATAAVSGAKCERVASRRGTSPRSIRLTMTSEKIALGIISKMERRSAVHPCQVDLDDEKGRAQTGGARPARRRACAEGNFEDPGNFAALSRIFVRTQNNDWLAVVY
ncbi:hypothetical protein Y032_0762g2141 [Ancylostoma ceylanicum]|uniref:Uncharacterized protein n=1 Tax=Ancylostoma ceylanicum TaxID=53326 RepID=A0A016WE02_9BILA|nr:hypothetical protein Y032_0762g2141 [Ancylostoma ceylanicum]